MDPGVSTARVGTLPDVDGPEVSPGRREEVRIPLPDGFDPAKHQTWLLQKLAERRGSGWKIDLVDMKQQVALASRTLTLTQVSDLTKSTKIVTLQTDVKPSDGDRLTAQFAEQFPGFHMTSFEPHLGRARLSEMSPAEVHARGALAVAMRVKPWQIQVTARVGGGFDIELPPSYLPSKHDGLMDEVAGTVIGEPGWYAKFDGKTRKGAIVPGVLPTFPATVPHPLGRAIKPTVRNLFDASTGDWGRIPIGVLLAKPGEPDEPTAAHRLRGQPGHADQRHRRIRQRPAAHVADDRRARLTAGRSGLVDAVKACVDYVDLKPFLKPGSAPRTWNRRSACCRWPTTKGNGARR